MSLSRVGQPLVAWVRVVTPLVARVVEARVLEADAAVR